MIGKPFIKLFAHSNRFYCYDIGSNNIMEVDKPFYDLLSLSEERFFKFTSKNPDNGKSNLNKYKHEYSDSLAEITKLNKEKGWFSGKNSIDFKFPFSFSEYDAILRNCVNHIVLNITEKCNFRCHYCEYANDLTKAESPPNSMPNEIIKKSIDFLINHSSHFHSNAERGLTVGFYGGEPLIEQKKIFGCIEYIEKNYHEYLPKIQFAMTTNGSLLNQSIINKLIKYNFSILVSLDGPKDIHDRYRRFKNGEGSFDIVMKNLDLIRSIDKEYYETKVGYSIVIAPPFELERIYEFFSTERLKNNRVILMSGVEDHNTGFLDRFDMYAESKQLRSQELRLIKQYKKLLAKCEDSPFLENMFFRSLMDIHKRIVRPIPKALYPNGICLPGIQKTFVDTKGNFHMCEKVGLGFSIGNVHSGFNSESIWKIVNEYLGYTKECNDCWCLRLCKLCYASVIQGPEFSKEKRRLECERRKKGLETLLQRYVQLSEEFPDLFNKEYHEDTLTLEVFKFIDSWHSGHTADSDRRMQS